MLVDDRYYDAAHRHEAALVGFLTDLIERPSMSRSEADVVQRIGSEMTAVGFEDVKIDPLGSVIGRFGTGPVTIVYDSHIDTVAAGALGDWKSDPFKASLRNGVIFGRGASDNKAAIASMVYGVSVMKEIGVDASGFSVYVIGTVQEEDCDGLALEHALRSSISSPDVVVLGEATNLQVYRGHRGRVEFVVRTSGRSAHASAPERGINAVYRMGPIISEIEALNARLAVDPFLGKGTVVLSKIEATTPSLSSVPDGCSIFLDRRLTVGETVEQAQAEIEALAGVRDDQAQIEVLRYEGRAYTGTPVSQDKYFPTWVTDEAHPAVRAGVAAGSRALGRKLDVGRWVFSTNGVASAGRMGIPTIGFGPANEIYAHSPDDQCAVKDLCEAAAWYAAFPDRYCEEVQR
ncbi:MAG: YgeY family selenium metabolism-linked hydrolase [Candidatus Dormibacteria bacterium]